MAVRLIGYDLSKPGQDYDGLFDEIKSLGTWWHCLDSTWLVDTELSASEIRDRVNEQVDTNDSVAVFTISSTGGWATASLSEDCNEWLHNYI